ncbi:unnamed protein product [Rotaria sp. Silwood1]|nr:unnamed protein product [Rotaria sp. Silwood1]
MAIGSPVSSILLKRLRTHKTIQFQSKLSSPIENNVNEGSAFHLTCSFLSNFDKIDIYWFHNGTLIESFISKKNLEEEDDDVEDSFLGVSIISTINIEKISFDMNGSYQCVGVYQHIHVQHTFHVHVNTSQNNSSMKNSSIDSFITVHTSQALFEPRNYVSLMCRFASDRKDECKTKWFNPYDKPLDTFNETTDLILQNATFDDSMGLYTCRICCSNQCQELTSFVYPAEQER